MKYVLLIFCCTVCMYSNTFVDFCSNNSKIVNSINDFRISRNLNKFSYDSKYDSICYKYLNNVLTNKFTQINLNKNNTIIKIHIHEINTNYNILNDLQFSMPIKNLNISLSRIEYKNKYYICMLFWV